MNIVAIAVIVAAMLIVIFLSKGITITVDVTGEGVAPTAPAKIKELSKQDKKILDELQEQNKAADNFMADLHAISEGSDK